MKRVLLDEQNLSTVRIGIVVLRLGSTKLPDLVEYAREISEALRAVGPGELLAVQRRRALARDVPRGYVARSFPGRPSIIAPPAFRR